jgi:Zn-dependent peptidase ImmA (M78 family)
MGIGKIETLKDVRERLLGYRLDSIPRLTNIPLSRLQVLEAGQSVPTVFEAEELSRVYGIDADLLADRRIRLNPNDVVEVFASLEEFRVIGDPLKAKIIEAANAAKDLREMERLSGRQPHKQLARIAYQGTEAPYQQGRDIALKFRQMLHLRPGPIASMRDLFRDNLPGVTLLYAGLGAQGVAGMALADRRRSATIVLNLEGKNENACVRRFSLAHELCHLVADWSRGQPIGILSGYYNDAARAKEQRANAFAVRFLCPEADLEKLPKDPSAAAMELMREYGLHYSAARLYLNNERMARLPEQASEELVVLASIDHRWEEAEAPNGIADFPLQSVPPERRTRIAALAALLYSRGQIQRDRFAELLRLTPADEVEKVLGFFDLDPPEAALGRQSATDLS